MKKAFFSHIRVCARILKEPYDDQYQECLRRLGDNEIEVKFETKLSEVSKNIVFQKRDKLMHSPEAAKEGNEINSQSQQFQRDDEIQATKNKLQDLIDKTELQIYKFDKVFNHEASDYKIFEEMFEKKCSSLSKKRKNIIVFNVAKSDTIINLQCQEEIFQKRSFDETSMKNLKVGVLPLMLNQIFQNKNSNSSTPSKLFEKNTEFDCIEMSSYLAVGNKFYDLLSPECKSYSSTKEVKKQKIENITCFKKILSNLKSQILHKKTSVDYICYKIKLSDSKEKSKNHQSTITLFDFPNPFEKNVEKEDKNSLTENLIPPLKILQSLLSNEKDNHLYKEKFFAQLSKDFKYDSKVMLFANLRPIHPNYQQSLNIIQLLNNIRKQSYNLETLFHRMVYHQLKQLQEKEVSPEFLPSAQKDELSLNISTSFSKNLNLSMPSDSSFVDQISTLESENKKLAAELDLRSKENIRLETQIKNLEEELAFIKTRTSKYLNELNEKHKNEIDNFVKIIQQLQSDLTIATSSNSSSPPVLQVQDQNSENGPSGYKKKVQTKTQNQNQENLQENYHPKNMKLLQNAVLPVYNYIEEREKRNQTLFSRVSEITFNKIELLNNKILFLENFNNFMRQSNEVLLKKVAKLMKELDKKPDVRAEVLVEVNERFKDLKVKMMKKLNAKNEEIQKYAGFFEDLEKRLGNLENVDF